MSQRPASREGSPRVFQRCADGRSLRLRFVHERGSAVVGWVMTAPLVLAVAIGGSGITAAATASLRAHAAAVRMAYAAAVAADPAARTAAVRTLAATACSEPVARWSDTTIAGIDMVVVHVECAVSVGPLGTRTVMASAHAPVERP